MDLKNIRRGRIAEYVQEFHGAKYYQGEKPWQVPCDLAFPCATQNEITVEDARALIKNGCVGVSEGANMPTVKEGIDTFLDAKLLFAPAKAANAGGVAVSGLEMSQNSERISWTEEDVQGKLRDIMRDIHDKCVEYGSEEGGYINYVKGANIGGFVKVANAMLAYGVI